MTQHVSKSGLLFSFNPGRVDSGAVFKELELWRGEVLCLVPPRYLGALRKKTSPRVHVISSRFDPKERHAPEGAMPPAPLMRAVSEHMRDITLMVDRLRSFDGRGQLEKELYIWQAVCRSYGWIRMYGLKSGILDVTPHSIMPYVCWLLLKEMGGTLLFAKGNSITNKYVVRQGVIRGFYGDSPSSDVADGHEILVTQESRGSFFSPQYMTKQLGVGWRRSGVTRLPKLSFDPRRLRDLLYGNLRRVRMYRLYQSLCTVESRNPPSDNYVLVALHYQPEATTIPRGGPFAQQYAMVRVLSESVPRGWKVVVREHPTFFARGYWPDPKYRSKSFYDALRALPNVVFATIDSHPTQLIAEARCIATITGNIGVEALRAGKPVLCFGDADYLGLSNVYLVGDPESCKEVLNKIENGPIMESSVHGNGPKMGQGGTRTEGLITAIRQCAALE